MAIQTVNTGTTPNDGTGDPARTAFTKLNSNFTTAENAASHLLLGTVSQSGGMPTGAIIEKGSNANGQFVRFADGTQICQVAKADSSISIDVALSGGFRSTGISWSYPIGFVDIPDVTASPCEITAFGVQASGTTISSCTYVYTSVTSESAASRKISLVAIGRWY